MIAASRIFQSARRLTTTPGHWALLLLGCAPLAANLLMSTSSSRLPVLVLVYAALAWAAYFHVFVAHRAADLKLGVATALFTLAIGVPLGKLLGHTPPLSFFYAMTTAEGGARRIVGHVFADGLNEELLKALPLWLLAFGFGRIRTPLDGIFLGALSGLGFAIFEGAVSIAHVQYADDMLMTTLVRTTALPLLHATFTAIDGYFIAHAAIAGQRRIQWCLIGIGTASALHGCYDFASNAIQLAVAAIVYLLFILCVDRSEPCLTFAA